MSPSTSTRSIGQKLVSEWQCGGERETEGSGLYSAEIYRNNPHNEVPDNSDDKDPSQRQFEVSSSESTFTISASSSGSMAMPMKHLKTLLSGLQVRLKRAWKTSCR